MPIVFHVARISFLFGRENLSALKGKAVSSCDTKRDTSQFTLWCLLFRVSQLTISHNRYKRTKMALLSSHYFNISALFVNESVSF